jgi:hypothetical protein
MPTIDYTDYEALTVAELKDMADQLGIDIPHDARKADIIDALKAAAQKEDLSSEAPAKEGAEGKNVYNYQTSSTTEGLMSPDDFWKIKLTS